MRKSLVFVMWLCVFSMGTMVWADTYAYSVRSNVDDHLYLINLDTGGAVDIGPVGFLDVEGLAWQPGTGVLFGVDDFSETLINIDTLTGVGSTVGGGSLFANQSNVVADLGLAFTPDGALYMATDYPEYLYSIDPSTGLASKVGSQRRMVNGLACSADGIMYGLGGDGSNTLLRINLSLLGFATTIGPLVNVSVNNGGLDFAGDGTLWGIDSEGAVFTIDTSTGAATVVSTTLMGFESLAIIPEPATIGLMLLGGIGLVRRKRK